MKFNNGMELEYLFDHDNWYLVKEKAGVTLVVHGNCPLGANVRPEGAVMHWVDHVCQQCKAEPPIEIIGAYILHYWDDKRRMDTFKESYR